MTREITCQEAAQYLYRYLDGELEPRTRAEFLRHLEACRKCLGVVEFERRMLDFIRVRAATERPPVGLQDRVRRIFKTDGESSDRGEDGSPDDDGSSSRTGREASPDREERE